jgi:uncharacterized protein YkwD
MKFYSEKRIIDLSTFALTASFLVFSIQSIQASGMTSAETVKLVNNARTSQNLPELAVNEKLAKAAENKINDMIKNDYFAHTSPAGITPWTWIEKAGYEYKFAGENLAINFSSAEDQQAAWMKSETHKKNILSPDYKEIGAAVKEGTINGESTTITVQEFGAQNIYAATDENGKVAGAESDNKVFASNPSVETKTGFTNFSPDFFITAGKYIGIGIAVLGIIFIITNIILRVVPARKKEPALI